MLHCARQLGALGVDLVHSPLLSALLSGQWAVEPDDDDDDDEGVCEMYKCVSTFTGG